MTFELDRKKLEQMQKAITDLKSEIQELEAHFPTWIHTHKEGSNKYRPIARRIVLSSQRLEQLVKENTY